MIDNLFSNGIVKEDEIVEWKFLDLIVIELYDGYMCMLIILNVLFIVK